MSDAKEHLKRIRDQFTRQAEAYARMRQATDESAFERLVTFARARSEDRVLDVACGPAFLTMVFAAHCAEAVGFDATDKFLLLAQEEARRRDLGNVTFRHGDAEKLPFGDEEFDLVICRAVFHHLLHPAYVLSEMKRVAKPGGRILVVDMLTSEEPAQAEYHNRMERLCDPSHTRALPKSELMLLFSDLDIEVVDVAESVIDYRSVEEWMEHGGPPHDAAQEILKLMDESIVVDRCGLNVRREAGKLRFTHRLGAFLGRVPS
jgi:ubiquinone/menaquinone biosynthesis C-methylase UbiE